MEKIVHGFLSSCLDYCNALFTRINKSSPSHLQAIQNDDARLLRHSAKRAEISHTYIKSTKWTSSKLFCLSFFSNAPLLAVFVHKLKIY